MSRFGAMVVLIAGLSVDGAAAQASGGFAERLFSAVDVNRDGRLGPREISAARSQRFDLLDADGDGFVTADELEAAAARLRRFARRADPSRAMRFDVDRDGRLSRREFVRRPGAPGLALTDADGDGFVSRAEFIEAIRRRSAQ